MLLNALTKVIYSIIREKYGLDYGSGQHQQSNAAVKKLAAKKGKNNPKKKKKHDSDDSEFEESDF